jgi:hypothetical protein
MSDMPKYRLTRAAHNRPSPGRPLRVMKAGEEIETNDVPGYHMEPINDAAKEVVRKLGLQSQEDPERVAIRNLATAKFDPNANAGVQPAAKSGK